MYPRWVEFCLWKFTEILLREVKLLFNMTQILEITSNFKFMSANLKTFWELGSQVPALFPPLRHRLPVLHAHTLRHKVAS